MLTSVLCPSVQSYPSRHRCRLCLSVRPFRHPSRRRLPSSLSSVPSSAPSPSPVLCLSVRPVVRPAIVFIRLCPSVCQASQTRATVAHQSTPSDSRTHHATAHTTGHDTTPDDSKPHHLAAFDSTRQGINRVPVFIPPPSLYGGELLTPGLGWVGGSGWVVIFQICSN